VNRSTVRPRCSVSCAPGRISSASGPQRMTLITRSFLTTCALVLLGACAHKPAAPPEREPIVIPAAPTGPETTVVPPSPVDGATPLLTMPRQLQHHKGSAYDDFFNRIRADF